MNKVDDDDVSGVYWFLGAIITISAFVILPSFKEMFTLFFNPEYWALNQVISLLKGSVKF